MDKVFLRENQSTVLMRNAELIKDMLEEGFLEVGQWDGSLKHRTMLWMNRCSETDMGGGYSWILYPHSINEYMVHMNGCALRAYACHPCLSGNAVRHQEAVNDVMCPRFYGGQHMCSCDARGHMHGLVAMQVATVCCCYRGGAHYKPDIKAFLQKRSHLTGLALHRVLFGSGGHEKRPGPGGPLRHYTKCKSLFSFPTRALASTFHLCSTPFTDPDELDACAYRYAPSGTFP